MIQIFSRRGASVACEVAIRAGRRRNMYSVEMYSVVGDSWRPSGSFGNVESRNQAGQVLGTGGR